eukprot:3070644-Amphidinium_carterae.1
MFQAAGFGFPTSGTPGHVWATYASTRILDNQTPLMFEQVSDNGCTPECEVQNAYPEFEFLDTVWTTSRGVLPETWTTTLCDRLGTTNRGNLPELWTTNQVNHYGDHGN